MTNGYPGLRLCTEHFSLVGLYEGREHRCGCVPEDEAWRESEWRGYDLPRLIAICMLCVRNVMRSGSRWSWYACETCRAVNRRVAEEIGGTPRSQVVPLGVHAIMNGTTLSGDEVEDSSAAKRFTDSLTSMFGVQRRLIRWRVREGNRLLGTSNAIRERIPLDDWLTRFPSATGASAHALIRFLGEDDLPDIPGLADLRAERDAFVNGGK